MIKNKKNQIVVVEEVTMITREDPKKVENMIKKEDPKKVVITVTGKKKNLVELKTGNRLERIKNTVVMKNSTTKNSVEVKTLTGKPLKKISLEVMKISKLMMMKISLLVMKLVMTSSSMMLKTTFTEKKKNS